MTAVPVSVPESVRPNRPTTEGECALSQALAYIATALHHHRRRPRHSPRLCRRPNISPLSVSSCHLPSASPSVSVWGDQPRAEWRNLVTAIAQRGYSPDHIFALGLSLSTAGIPTACRKNAICVPFLVSAGRQRQCGSPITMSVPPP
jgi:hypothetical protein